MDARDELTKTVIGLAMKVHRALGPGFYEFVYRNALAHELGKVGIAVEVEKSLEVSYDGVIVGRFDADLYVADWLLCELKAVKVLAPEHEVQTVNYLTAVRQDFGLLLNFGSDSLEVKRKYRRTDTDASSDRPTRKTFVRPLNAPPRTIL